MDLLSHHCEGHNSEELKWRPSAYIDKSKWVAKYFWQNSTRATVLIRTKFKNNSNTSNYSNNINSKSNNNNKNNNKNKNNNN